MSLTQTNEANFDKDVLKANKPVLVDFWAEWCGPCRALLPVLEEVSKEINDQAHIIKVNVDENPNIASQYGVRGIPTLIFFKGGVPQRTLVGSQSKNEISKTIKELL